MVDLLLDETKAADGWRWRMSGGVGTMMVQEQHRAAVRSMARVVALLPGLHGAEGQLSLAAWNATVDRLLELTPEADGWRWRWL